MTKHTITATVVPYRFDLTKSDQQRAYDELCAGLMQRGYRCTRSQSPSCGPNYQRTSRDQPFYDFWDKVPKLKGVEIQIQTDYLFADQSNTAPLEGVSEIGLRLHDWAEAVWPNKFIKQGYYLDKGIDELRALRSETLKCGFCGAQYRQQDLPGTFCTKCLSSQQLTRDLLHLTKLRLVADQSAPPLTEAELAELLPSYQAAQQVQHQEELKRQRQRCVEEFRSRSAVARTQYLADLWLLDRRLSTEDRIYYPHTGRFSFGWLAPVSPERAKEIYAVLQQGFAWPAEIKVAGQPDFKYQPEPQPADPLGHLDPVLLRQIVDRIHEILDTGEEFDVGQLDDIAEVLTEVGYEIRNCDEFED